MLVDDFFPMGTTATLSCAHGLIYFLPLPLHFQDLVTYFAHLAKSTTGSDPHSPTLYRSDDLESSMALVHLTGRSETGTTVYSPERSRRPKARISTSPTPGAGPALSTLLSVEEEDTPVREFVDWLSDRSEGDISPDEETFLTDYFDNLWRLHEQWMGTSWMDNHLTYVSWTAIQPLALQRSSMAPHS